MNPTPLNPVVTTDELHFRYPRAGDERPPGGAQVLLLTCGHICVRGTWNDSFLGWCPLPKRDKAKEAMCSEH